jgi:hypothetical protein
MAQRLRENARRGPSYQVTGPIDEFEEALSRARELRMRARRVREFVQWMLTDAGESLENACELVEDCVARDPPEVDG